jgi:hypothetical protein
VDRLPPARAAQVITEITRSWFRFVKVLRRHGDVALAYTKSSKVAPAQRDVEAAENHTYRIDDNCVSTLVGSFCQNSQQLTSRSESASRCQTARPPCTASEQGWIFYT